MSAFLIATVAIHDKEAFAEYGKLAGPTLEAAGAEILTHGAFVQSLDDGDRHDIGAVIRFKDRDTLLAWYNSPEYQQAIEQRNKGAKVSFTVYDKFD